MTFWIAVVNEYRGVTKGRIALENHIAAGIFKREAPDRGDTGGKRGVG